MKRYDLMDEGLEPFSEGVWVRHQDVIAALDAFAAKERGIPQAVIGAQLVAELRAALEHAE